VWVAVGAGVVGLTVVLIAGFVLLSKPGTTSTAGPKFSPSVTAAQGETVVQGQGGHWINVTPDRLAQMLAAKDFTLLNVKTPYIGEIDGTDLYIPYDHLAARASELPQAKSGRILVYCRSGAESAIAAQTLLNLGYTNVWNLDGGMNAWQASGRTLVNLNR
jgi:rhodanese-related sulfurtransferase